MERPSPPAWLPRPPADPQVAFTVSGSAITFTPKVNTGGVVSVSGYTLWLVTESPGAFIAANIADSDQRLQLDWRKYDAWR